MPCGTGIGLQRETTSSFFLREEDAETNFRQSSKICLLDRQLYNASLVLALSFPYFNSTVTPSWSLNLIPKRIAFRLLSQDNGGDIAYALAIKASCSVGNHLIISCLCIFPIPLLFPIYFPQLQPDFNITCS
jgi:hypothetical protein